RLVNLQGLKDKGLITEEEYKEKRGAILAEL
ncbi:MAG: SHOCT domain-containing protein, partial [Kiritimatiellae bacterium]|nr:SHOCT domain-containing protein [Kiritimatiellia bacterium]